MQEEWKGMEGRKKWRATDTETDSSPDSFFFSVDNCTK